MFIRGLWIVAKLIQKFLTIFLIFHLNQGCGRNSPSNTPKNIYGVDDRVEYLESHVGRLGNSCSGTVVSDKIVLTAAHCVHGKNFEKNPMRFILNQKGSKNQFITLIEHSWTGWDNDREKLRKNDWALLKTRHSLGKVALPNPMQEVNLENKIGLRIKSVGFGSTFENANLPAYDPNCQITGYHPTEKGLFFNNCDSEIGFSGGPIFDDKENLIGINVAEFRGGAKDSLRGLNYSPSRANLSIDIKAAHEKFLELQEAI